MEFGIGYNGVVAGRKTERDLQFAASSSPLQSNLNGSCHPLICMEFYICHLAYPAKHSLVFIHAECRYPDILTRKITILVC